MRRIIIKEARPGMVAARTLSTAAADGKKISIAGAGETLTIEHLIRSHDAGVYDLWVGDPGLEFCDELCAQPTSPQVRLADGLRDSLLRLSSCLPRTIFKRYALVLQEILHAMLKTAPSVPCFAAFTEDEALLAHSCDVAVLSILLGLQLEGYLVEQRRRLNCKQARCVVNLALGALFHDVGELMLPSPQRESRGGSLEGDAWKQHTAEGYNIVRGHLDPSAAAAVLHHHQHFDGTGFAELTAGACAVTGGNAPADPNCRVLLGGAIHVYARIVMAADVFCQTLFAGARLPQPMVKALWQLQQAPLRTSFDSVIHQCLLGMFQPFVEGAVVGLNDHRQAVVTRVEAQFPCFPEVRALTADENDPGADRQINLSERADLRIEVIDGLMVEGFMFGMRKSAPSKAA